MVDSFVQKTSAVVESEPPIRGLLPREGFSSKVSSDSDLVASIVADKINWDRSVCLSIRSAKYLSDQSTIAWLYQHINKLLSDMLLRYTYIIFVTQISSVP